jgi:hypothetical protein
MAKKATSKVVKVESPKDDILEDIIPTPTTQGIVMSDLDDDDPFSSGTQGAVVPKRIEPDDDLLGVDDEPDDFGHSFLEKDKEISETFINKVEEVVGKNTIPEETVTELECLKEENARLKKEFESLPKLGPVTISDQFDQLYQTLKEGRATELLMAVQKDYLDLKYNSYTEKERKEIELHLKEFLRERFEGKVKAAKLIHKQDEKGKS